MKRDEFTSLPLPLALGLLYDVSVRLQNAEAPKVPRPPKFDAKVYRKGGFCWASEMQPDDLRYWQGRKQQSAEAGGQYAEKDAKAANNLGYWVTWRECFPTERWTGERDRVMVTAKPPSRDPELHQNAPRQEAPSADYSFDDGAGEAVADAEASQYDL